MESREKMSSNILKTLLDFFEFPSHFGSSNLYRIQRNGVPLGNEIGCFAVDISLSVILGAIIVDLKDNYCRDPGLNETNIFLL